MIVYVSLNSIREAWKKSKTEKWVSVIFEKKNPAEIQKIEFFSQKKSIFLQKWRLLISQNSVFFQKKVIKIIKILRIGQFSQKWRS